MLRSTTSKWDIYLKIRTKNILSMQSVKHHQFYKIYVSTKCGFSTLDLPSTDSFMSATKEHQCE